MLAFVRAPGEAATRGFTQSCDTAGCETAVSAAERESGKQKCYLRKLTSARRQRGRVEHTILSIHAVPLVMRRRSATPAASPRRRAPRRRRGGAAARRAGPGRRPAPPNASHHVALSALSRGAADEGRRKPVLIRPGLSR